MPQTATIEHLPAAFRMMKAMQAEGVEWGEDYRQGARDAVSELLRGRMDQLIDQHLECMVEVGQADRRNGCDRRHLLTELGDFELAVPRTRPFSALKVVRVYARRARDVDLMILASFVGRLGTGLQPRSGPTNACSGSRPARWRPHSCRSSAGQPRYGDCRGQATRCRRGCLPSPLQDQYRVLVLDGVVLNRKTGAGALAWPVLLALGLRPDGKKEVSSWATWCAAG